VIVNQKHHIWFVLGTAGELIKMYPVIQRCTGQGLSWSLIHTGQSGVNFWRQWQSFGLPTHNQVFKLCDHGHDLQNSSSAGKWFFNFLLTGREQVRAWPVDQQPRAKDLFVVHGDTLSTLAGAILAKRLNGRVFHVEAGLRSEDLLEPFPEEINRRLTSILVDVHYAPDQRAYHNLFFGGVSGRLVNSGGNTLMDAILDMGSASTRGAPEVPFVVANLHRYENLHNEARWQMLIETTLKAQQSYQVVFAMHAPTEGKLKLDIEGRKRLEAAGVILKPRIPFEEFVSLLHNCEYVLSDGGSNQEECYCIGKPCLILRDTTERFEGLGENAVLSRMQNSKIDHFLENHKKFVRSPVRLKESPSQLIATDLLRESSELPGVQSYTA
jgi:UDP-N-acetylglucosamine 2-epimerase (non-hydrolysing)